MRAPDAVSDSTWSIVCRSDDGSRSRRPRMVRRTPFSRHRFASPSRARRNRRMSAVTSGVGRFQLSDEKAYSVSVPTTSRTAASTISRAVRSPASWPAERESPCAVAHRPLPSMITATCGPAKEVMTLCAPECRDFCISCSAFPDGANERLHVIDVPLQGATAVRGELVLRPWHSALERLRAGDVLRVLELARMHAQVSVGGAEQELEVIERHGVIGRERAHDPEPHALVDQAIEPECPLVGGALRVGRHAVHGTEARGAP